MAMLGFVLGMRHALDPDHVVAITTIVSTERSVGKAGLIGTMWGLGHTVTIFIVGSAIIIFNIVIPPRLGLSLELAVGGMLILLGLLTLTGMVQRMQQKFTMPTGHRKAFGLYNLLRPLLVGIVHGLAGSAAVALLAMAAIRVPWISVAYLLLFGLGTIAGMILITAAISTPFIHTAHRYSHLNRGLTLASGLISLGLGLFVSYRIGFVQGLFGSHPQWVPQ
jgi:high-affinity nickel-transport protein